MIHNCLTVPRAGTVQPMLSVDLNSLTAYSSSFWSLLIADLLIYTLFKNQYINQESRRHHQHSKSGLAQPQADSGSGTVTMAMLLHSGCDFAVLG